MVTIHVPQYNDNLINIVAYILKNYPICCVLIPNFIYL